MRSKQLKDLRGNVYGRLTVVALAPRINGRTVWRCKCLCGISVTVHRTALVSGNTQSCGCLWRDNQGANQKRKLPRGRNRTGKGRPPSKLTLEAVGLIRRELSRGVTHAALGERFKVDRSTISDIASGRIWASKRLPFKLQNIETGEIEETFNLSEWARQHGMTYKGIANTRRQRLSCKGWKLITGAH